MDSCSISAQVFVAPCRYPLAKDMFKLLTNQQVAYCHTCTAFELQILVAMAY